MNETRTALRGLTWAFGPVATIGRRYMASLFDGSADESLLLALSRSIRQPRNEAQRAFWLAWHAFEFVNSDGFEILFEQSAPFEEFGAAFGKIGMPSVEPLFSKVLALIPTDLRLPKNEESLCVHLQDKFEDLKALAYEFFALAGEFVPVAARFVRDHRDDFSEYDNRLGD
jgi:hypothetical protein